MEERKKTKKESERKQGEGESVAIREPQKTKTGRPFPGETPYGFEAYLKGRKSVNGCDDRRKEFCEKIFFIYNQKKTNT